MRLAATLLVLLVLLASGCGSDLGLPCDVLTTGGQPLEQGARPEGDLVSATAECAHQACLSNAGAPAPAGEGASVIGYCSRPCAKDSDCPLDRRGRRAACGELNGAETGSVRYCWYR